MRAGEAGPSVAMANLRVLTTVILMLGLSACATTTETDRATGRGGDAVIRPLRDLSLVGTPIPAELAASATAPYGVERPRDCTARCGGDRGSGRRARPRYRRTA